MNTELSKLLKDKRFKQDMSLREFSSFLGISHAYLSKLEKGVDPRTGKEIIPTIETINKIADGLDIDRTEFYKLCGYTQDREEEKNKPELVDIKKYFSKILSVLEDGTEFELDGRILKKNELGIISQALEVGFTLALKNLV